MGAKSTPILTTSVESSGAVTIWSTLSLVQPSWDSRNTGVFSSLITRCSDQAASPAVDRVAGSEVLARADLEGEGLAVVADLYAFRNAWDEFFDVRGLEAHDAVIGVGQNLDARELIGFGGVERDDVVDLLGDHQRIGRCRGLRLRREREQRSRQQRVLEGFPHAVSPWMDCSVVWPDGLAATAAISSPFGPQRQDGAGFSGRRPRIAPAGGYQLARIVSPDIARTGDRRR